MSSFALVAALGACAPVPGGEVAVAVEEAETEWIQSISLEASAEIPTAYEARWATPEIGIGWVEFSIDGEDEWWSTSVGPAGIEHAIPVVGLPRFSTAQLRLVVEIDGARHESAAIAVEVGGLPADPPEIYTESPGDVAPGWFVATTVAYPPTLMIFDRQGRPVWAWTDGDMTFLGTDLVLDPYANAILYNRFSTDHVLDQGTIHAISLMGEPLWTLATPNAHHSFVTLEDGSLIYLAMDAREVDGWGVVVGDQIIERSPDGVESVLFNTWDALDVIPGEAWAMEFYPEASDWTHANTLSWDGARESFLLTLAGSNQVLEVGRGGELLQVLGGQGRPASDYIFEPEGAMFSWPHGAHWSAAGDLLLFSTVYGISAGRRYQAEGDVLYQTGLFGAEEGYSSLALGSLRELEDGHLLLNWGTSGVIQELSADGELLWEAQLPIGEMFGEVLFLPAKPAAR